MYIFLIICCLSSCMYCCFNNPQANLEWFCLQDVRTSNPPIRAAQSGTLCSQCSSTSISVCLHSSVHPRVGLFFYSVAGFTDCRSDISHNRPSVSKAFLHLAGFRYRGSSHQASIPRVASPIRTCFSLDVSSQTDSCDNGKEVRKTDLTLVTKCSHFSLSFFFYWHFLPRTE